ncbi:MAG: threonylcarbamoyl-AMP synthase [Chloroflexi bacterium]|jgi:L-threonylcarbamoyladenylate synthase|nr:threonylcarbamoyl-AMP synthase [Chloroflexota bacterium]MBT3670991.1 threonylcarbamoyl-AMP synthase [Chloroflexota bacterium]MBT4003196.1 threonylcarbamoyl-AMP synthase [Chloroflexota bacterium]MBT4305024.1 threonylcarbamoyl-AMP synthase [Chloroflexota bacterium]MBT4533835.1 threonylcarbamoyl-AMP synthase [Chloroflexota bacterium]
MNTKIINSEDPDAIAIAMEVLKENGTVAFPTDTVYGLATLTSESEVIKKLFVIKDRDEKQAIAVLIGQDKDLELVAEHASEKALRLANAFWPGALTLIVPRNPNLPDILSPLPTIGVRIPDHPFAIELMKMSGPLAVTSANLSGGKNTMNAKSVLDQLDGKIDLIIDGGETPGGSPSTVVDVRGNEPIILREGPITEEEILAVWIKK